MISLRTLRIIIFFTLLHSVAFDTTKSTERLRAILAFKNIEEVHLQVVQNNYGDLESEPAEEAVESHSVKIDFCHNALRSRIVQQLAQIPTAQADTLTSAEYLRWDIKRFRDMEFMDILPRRKETILQKPFRFPTTRPFYVPSRMRSRNHNENVVDFVDNTLMYVTKDDSRPSVAYIGCYVSKQYNVNLSHPIPYVAGRFFYFVYLRSENDPDREAEVYQVRLLATEAASSVMEDSSPTVVKNLYLRMRNRDKTAEKAQDDPVCKLSSIVLGHICSTVLNSYYFSDMVVEQMGIKGVSCYKQKIWFESEPQTEHVQWMINCQTRMRDPSTGEQFWYHISRGRSSKNFFVFVYSHSTAPFPVIRLVTLSSNVVKYFNLEMND